MKSLVLSQKQKVNDLDLLSDRNLAKIQQWNGEQPVIVDRCMHHVVHDQVRERPDHMAICSREVSFTYRELEDLSSRLALQLSTLGVGPEVYVPFCFDKSPWTIVALLAILKAGGACVALDPKHPRDRLEGILNDVKAKLVVTTPHHRNLFTGLVDITVALEPEMLYQLPSPTSTVCADVTPSNPAFVVFTSGSTGKPKGIILEHRALVTSAHHHSTAMRMGTDSRVLQFAAYTFDVSIGDIFTTLMRGGTVCVPTEHERFNDLAGCITRMDVNWAYLTPSVAAMLDPAQVPSLNTLALGGEAVRQENITTWANSVYLINIYGPAECSIWSTVLPGLSSTTPASNIGLGIGAFMWVVDPNNVNRLAPIGSVGELAIEGPILARGYLNLPERTSQAFLSGLSWLTQEGSSPRRIYRTGDLVRYNEKGQLHYVARSDSQVKLRGQRIELGEVEHHIKLEFSGISDVAVDMVKFASKNNSSALVAFLVPDMVQPGSVSDSTLEMSDTLRESVANGEVGLVKALPPYMLPSTYIPVASLPLSASGKLDRRKLRSVVESLSEEKLSDYSHRAAKTLQPLTTPMQYKLRDLWAEVLNSSVDLIGATDTFFGMGGDSVTAMRLVAAAGKSGLVLTVADIFSQPTLSGMAQLAKSTTTNESLRSADPILRFDLLEREVSRQALFDDFNDLYGIDANVVDDIYPPTPLQEGLMVISARQPGAYMAQQIFALPPGIDVERFKGAWSTTVQNIPILRTRIAQDKSGKTYQAICSSSDSIEWQHSDDKLDRYLKTDRQIPTEYGRPLARYALVDEGEATAGSSLYFVWSIHHALYDGFSLPMVIEQMTRAYEGSELLQLGPFNKYIKFISESSPESSNEFWRGQLDSAAGPHFPQLPSPSHKIHSDSRIVHRIKLPRKAGSNITSSILLRAAWALLLSRYTDSDDVVFGATLTGRNVPVAGIENVVGPTMATVPIRVKHDWNKTVSSYLSEVSSQSTAMMLHEHVGIQNIQKLGPEFREASNFLNLLVVQPVGHGSDESRIGMKPVTKDEVSFDTYPLTVECRLGSNKSVEMEAIYDNSVISSTQMKRILHQFEHVAMQLAVESPTQGLAELDILSKHDKQEILNWNYNAPPKTEACIHQVFEQQALRQPAAAAVSAWDVEFTYHELDDLSTQLAMDLLSLGVKPEMKIPLCFEKSGWTIVAMLGVLKAGAAFVLLDPSHPFQRLGLIVRETNAAFIISSEAKFDICSTMGPRVLILSSSSYTARPVGKSQPVSSSVMPSNAAYVIFTSGTTGKPKGSVIEHAAFATSAQEHGKALLIKPASRVLQFASYSFDAVLVEILTTLTRGGCVCVPSEDERSNDLVGFINRHNINHAVITPSLARLLRPESIPGLRSLVLAGEAMTREDLLTWSRVELVNGYGPSECSVCVAANVMSPHSDPAQIGSAVGGRNWIVDPKDHNRLAPVGCIGELLVEGNTLAREYLNNYERTSETFIENPTWASEDNGVLSSGPRRFYKTGDLVRYNDDGTSGMTFFGRKDQQIKLNGQRIELGDIEYNFKRAMPLASDIAVEVISRPSGKALIAFICMNQHQSGDQSSKGLGMDLAEDMSAVLRQELIRVTAVMESSLPLYMIPTIFVPLRTMPLNLSGKLNRAHLLQLAAQLDLSRYSLSDNKKTAPSSEMEVSLHKIWVKVLNVASPESIGVEDHFFRIGGDSIAAMKLASSVQSMGLSLNVADIFRSPVLKDMANMLLGSTPSASAPVPFSILGEDIELSVLFKRLSSKWGINEDAIHDIYPATPTQEGLIALSAKQPGAYVAQHSFVLPRSLDIKRFKAAWEETYKTTEILRTKIVPTEASTSLQVVTDDPLIWRTASSLEEYLDQDLKDPMSYGTSLSRFAIIEEQDASAQGRRYFSWTLHHAIYDGWCAPLILEKLCNIYDGEPVQMATPFSNYIRHLAASDLGAANKYWKTQLEGFTPVDFPALPVKVPQRVDSTLSHSVTMHRKLGSSFTMSTLIRAAWAILISTYSETEDVVFGATLSGRNAPVDGIASIVAPTITTVPVRTRVARNKSTIELLDEVQNRSTDMMPYENTGLQSIKRLGADADGACNFQNLLVIHPPSKPNARTTFMDLQRIEMGGETSFHTYPIVLECTPGDSAVGFVAQYDENIVDADQMKRILYQLEHVLRQLNAETPSQSVGNVSVISPEDRREINSWNASNPQYVDACVHELFQQQVSAQPNAQAVHAWDGTFTYAELDRVSTKLAKKLVTMGIEPEDVVPTCFEKSRWAPAAMLAVMKAGGACVSLDPSFPVDRLSRIVSECRASIILAGSNQVHAADQLNCLTVVVSDALIDSDESYTGPLSVCESVYSGNAAFLVFTSGSTGKPKGIVLEHGGVCSGYKTYGRAYGISTGSRVLQFAAYTFDVSMIDTFVTLIHGACLCIPSEHDRMNNLPGFIRSANVNWASITPTVADLLEPKDVPSLRRLVLAGEALPRRTVEKWANAVVLSNAYGPAETAATSIKYEVGHDGCSTYNIGYPVTSKLWVVDPSNRNNLVPVGCRGELLVEGPQLARGYLNDRIRTNESFIWDPAFIGKGNSAAIPRRFYRTGDIVQYNSDGSLDFVGRQDDQVKLHGQRIELGDVEYNILRHGSGRVKSVAVDVVQRSDKGQVLMAFIEFADRDDSATEPAALELEEEQAFFLRALKTALSSSLPPYMIPSSYIPMSRLPTNASGKTNRRELRRIAQAFSAEQLKFYALGSAKLREPSTPMEMKMRDLWAQVLVIEPSTIGADSSFFHLGGDSIAAMRLASVASDVGVSITVADIFRLPSLAEMSAACSFDILQPSKLERFELLGRDEDLTENILNDIARSYGFEQHSLEDAYPTTPLQEGLMALSNKQAGFYMAQNVFRIPDAVDLGRFKASWQEVVNSTEILRTRIIHTEALGAIQVVLKQAEINWTSGSDLESYLAHDKQRPILFGESLTRYALITPIEGVRYMVWTCHHSTYDGWSIPLVFNKLRVAYDGGDVADIATTPINGFIKYLMDVDKSKERAFWQTELQSASPVNFPRVLTSSSEPRGGFVQQTMDLPQVVTRGSNATLPTKLRAAWSVVVARYSGVDDVVFGATLSGRNAPVVGISSIVAPTIATVPVRVRLNPDQRISDFLAAVQDQATRMISYEHTGLQNIKQISADAQSACDFQNLLVIQPKSEATSINHSGNTAHSLIETVDTEAKDFDAYPLNLTCNLGDESIDLAVDYDMNTIPTEQVRRILYQFEQVFRQILHLESTGALVKNIEMISPQDKAELLAANREWPETYKACLHELVSSQARTTPLAHAVASWDGAFTYAELDCLSTKLSHHLRALGVRKEVYVALLFPKTKWMCVAILAVLKAGGAAVPMDPSQPLSRLEGLMSDVDAKAILTLPDKTDAFNILNIPVVSVDEASIAALDEPADDSSLQHGSPEDPAFVVFTSGSTGKPKGIILEHQSLATSFANLIRHHHLDSSSRLLQFAAYTFDASIEDIFMALMVGGCVCIPSDLDRLNDLVGAINRFQANWANLTSSVATLIKPSDVPSLKAIALGGEPVTSDNLAVWANKVVLSNTYGPAECSVDSTGYYGMTQTTTPNNIGYAATGLVWVVEPENHHKLSPLGSVGELLIEGPHVARGYIKNPEKTKAAFIEDPEWSSEIRPAAMPSTVAHRRFYKTGDLVSYNADMSLTFVGRADTQVKLHGQRIELGEIEQNLCAVADVRQGLVLLPKTGRCKNRLVAIISLKGVEQQVSSGGSLELVDGADKAQAAARASKIREDLLDMLPEYMIPTSWIVLDSVPLNSSLKIDRARLAAWVANMDEQTFVQISEYIVEERVTNETATAVERKLQAALGWVLKLSPEHVSLNKSFLALGGDSISAMQAVARCRHEGVETTVKDLLQSRSITKLAKLSRPLEDGARPGAMVSPLAVDGKLEGFLQELLPVLPVKSRDEIESICHTSSSQEEILQLSDRNLHAGFYNTDQVFEILPTSSSQRLSTQRLHDAWQAVVDRHASLRTIFVKNHARDGRFEQVTVKSLPAPIEQFYCQDEEDIDEILSSGVVFNPRKLQPLHQLVICQTPGGKVIAKFAAHHSIIDGPTILNLFQEFAHAYEGMLSTAQAPSFHEYISQLGQLDTELALRHWQATLSNATPCLLPTMNQPISGIKELKSVSRMVGGDHRLANFCEQHEVTVPSLFYTIWTLVLQRLTGRDEIAFGYLASARSSLTGPIAEAAGFFVDHVVSRSVDFAHLSGVALLRQVHDGVLESMPHQHVSPSDICSSLDLPTPLFNTLINFRKFDISNLENEVQEGQGGDGIEVEIPADTSGQPDEGLNFKSIRGNDPMAVSLPLCILNQ